MGHLSLSEGKSMLEFINRTPCSPDEIARLREYLSKSKNVPWMALEVDRALSVEKAEVTPLDEVGSLATIWKELGGHKTAHGGVWLVKEAFEVLQRPNCTDECSLETIRCYIERLASGEQLDLVLTILVVGSDRPLIVDGNKRTVACYQNALAKGISNYTLPVYVVTVPQA